MPMEAALILVNDGENFERFYYRAVCLGERGEAERLYARYLEAPAPNYWRDAFRKSGLRDVALLSAVAGEMRMPFGAYVFRRLDDDRMEIVPWRLSGKGEKTAGEDAKSLYARARSLKLTADFLAWLERYDGQRAAHTEGLNA